MNADISHGRPVRTLLQGAGHARELVGPQGGGTYGQGLLEPTLPRRLWLHPVMTAGGGSLMRPVPLFLPLARPVAKHACPADSSLNPSIISFHPLEEAEREGKRGWMTVPGP